MNFHQFFRGKLTIYVVLILFCCGLVWVHFFLLKSALDDQQVQLLATDLETSLTQSKTSLLLGRMMEASIHLSYANSKLKIAKEKYPDNLRFSTFQVEFEKMEDEISKLHFAEKLADRLDSIGLDEYRDYLRKAIKK